MIKKRLVYVLLAGLLLNCSSDKSPWIWEIDGVKYTVNDFDDAYENYIYLMAQQLQIGPEQLKKMIEHPEQSGVPEENLEMLRKLSKENFPDQYKQLLLLNTEAAKKGFLKKKENKARIKFVEQFYTASIFMSDSAQTKDTEISEEEALKAWEMIRKTNPQAQNIPLDKGIAATKQRLAMKKTFEKQQETVKEIIESYPVKTNPDFKLKDYIKKSQEQETSKPEEK